MPLESGEWCWALELQLRCVDLQAKHHGPMCLTLPLSTVAFITSCLTAGGWGGRGKLNRALWPSPCLRSASVRAGQQRRGLVCLKPEFHDARGIHSSALCCLSMQGNDVMTATPKYWEKTLWGWRLHVHYFGCVKIDGCLMSHKHNAYAISEWWVSHHGDNALFVIWHIQSN